MIKTKTTYICDRCEKEIIHIPSVVSDLSIFKVFAFMIMIYDREANLCKPCLKSLHIWLKDGKK